jgi:uncharacterized HAD superfamily protein
MRAYDNVIVTDVDGCCIYFEHGFHMWMVSKGYRETSNGFYNIHEKYNISREQADNLIDAFNESAALRRLPPVKDAIKYIRKLHEEHGYVFHAITAIPNTRDNYEARLENIENLFGKTAFERVTLCGESSNKKIHLKEYENTECFFIEDLFKNAMMGLNVGMRPLLMDRHYNRDLDDPRIKRVYNWKEIYQTIIGEEN